MAIASPAASAVRLPIGFAIRLHEDVVVGKTLSRGARLLRLDPAVLSAIQGRHLVVHDELSARVAERLLDLDLAVPELRTAGPFGLADLTVVIPVHDDTKGAERVLGHLAGGVACVVVDDASPDPGPIADVAERSGADFARLDVNMGPAVARNVGASRVGTTLVAFIDADVTVSTDDLAKLLGHFADPGLAAVAPRVLAAEGSRWFQQYERSAGGLDLGASPAAVRNWSSVAYVPSACLIVRMEAFGRGFDEDMRSGEDVDFVWRLLASGRRVRYEPSVVAVHAQRPTVSAWAKRQFFYGMSAAPLAERHGVLVAPAVLTPGQAGLVASMLLLKGRGRLVSLLLALHVSSRTWRAAGEGSAVKVQAASSVLQMTLRQGAGLVVHHGVPLSIAVILTSRRARRAIAVIGVVEGLAAWCRTDRSAGVAKFIVARRMATAAYGFGVWWGAARTGSWRAVLPHLVRTPRRRPS